MQPRHVLVADDEPHIGRIIKMKLEQGPFRVTLAYDGQEAIDLLEAQPDIDLVLLDLMMPNLSGLDVLARIRSHGAAEAPALHHPHGGRPGSAASEGDGARRDRVSHEAVQSQEAVRPDGGARGAGPGRARRGDRVSRWAAVLAGGVGSRFWPLSTASRPKQLLPLVDSRPLLVATLDRLAPLVPASQTLILTNASLTDAVREARPGGARREHHR